MNIDINPNVLNETINLLKRDNLNIKELINSIYKNIFKLTDDEVWKSPEKNIVLNECITYLNESNNNIYNQLNNCVMVLDNALNKYITENNVLEKSANKLSDIEIIEEL